MLRDEGEFGQDGRMPLNDVFLCANLVSFHRVELRCDRYGNGKGESGDSTRAWPSAF